jgi:adenylate cyclase
MRHVRRLERNQASLRSFFSPVVLEAIAESNAEDVLAPRECEVSVLFCDLRGFSLKSERAADNLMELLDRVSSALGVTTRQILDQRGVVGDFHGDAAMGFWGWPLEQPDRALRACQAAIEIQSQFAAFSANPSHPLHDFRIGVGIATGTAVAGRIGTDDQVKVSVFGPVVNLASRLESMTQQLRSEILIDQRTDELIRAGLGSSSDRSLRVRRLAIVQPMGIKSAIHVSQVLPVFGAGSQLSDADIAVYEQALDEFTDGRWDKAFELLHRVPAEDKAKDFLTVTIAQHNRTAPDNWSGFISLSQK